jgi:hypothetical protein
MNITYSTHEEITQEEIIHHVQYELWRLESGFSDLRKELKTLLEIFNDNRKRDIERRTYDPEFNWVNKEGSD